MLAIRQRCGFGCVICGLPVYEYDHMIGWAKQYEHDPENITLLCENHHGRKTRGTLSLGTVQKYNANPVNIAKGVTAPFLLDVGAEGPFRVKIGTNWFVGVYPMMVPLIIDDCALIGIQRDEGGQIGLWVQIYDRNNRRQLLIIDNELVMSTGVWDIKFEGQVLTIREGDRDVRLRIRFTPPDQIEIESAELTYNGVMIDVKPSGLRMNLVHQVEFVGSLFTTPVGIRVGDCPLTDGLQAVFTAREVDRYPGR